MKQSNKNGTMTSSFGSPGRHGHDSAKFYAGRLYEGLPQPTMTQYFESPLPESATNQVFCKSSESMDELPDDSVHLMVTSPPYNVGKVYDEDMTLAQYREFIMRVMAEVYRVLVPGGRICFNVANLGRKPYLPLDAYIAEDLTSLGFLMRGQIIWDKASSSSGSTAWGSWRSPANPTLRDIHEYILVFSKGMFSRPKLQDRFPTISDADFLELTKSIWRFPAESARKVGHPAPFPVELPRRCIELYTYSGDVVLDPFMGAGSTAMAAIDCKRRFVGYELDPDYARLCKGRVSKHRDQNSQVVLIATEGGS